WGTSSKYSAGPTAGRPPAQGSNRRATLLPKLTKSATVAHNQARRLRAVPETGAQTGPEAQNDPPALPGGEAHGTAPAGIKGHHRGGAGKEPRAAGGGGQVHRVPRCASRPGTRRWRGGLV